MNDLNKKQKSLLIIYLIAMIFMILAFILIPFKKSLSSWIALFFLLIAFVFSYFVFQKTMNNETIKSKIYGFPIIKVGIIYLFAQAIVSVIVWIINFFIQIPLWLVFIVSIALLMVAFIGIIASENALDMVIEEENKIEYQTKTISYFQINISSIINACSNEQLHKPLQNLAEQLRYSDPVSSDATKPYEDQIMNMLEELKQQINNPDTNITMTKIQTISNLIKERNTVCKMNK